MHPVPRIWEFRHRPQGHMKNNKVYTLPPIVMVVRLQEKKYSKMIKVRILIYILKIIKKYMRNQRLL